MIVPGFDFDDPSQKTYEFSVGYGYLGLRVARGFAGYGTLSAH